LVFDFLVELFFVRMLDDAILVVHQTLEGSLLSQAFNLRMRRPKSCLLDFLSC
jgi:hypothetical protein